MKNILLVFVFLPFVVFGQLLKEVKSLHENGNPEQIVFKNQDLEIVSIETYNKDKTLASRYNYDPLTKKVNGEFYSEAKVGDLEYVNKGTYNQNVLSSDQFTQFFGRQIIKGKIVSGLPVGRHKVFNLVSESYQQYDRSSSRALSRKVGENVNYYVNVESGKFKEEFVCNLNFNDAGLLDGKQVINPYTTLYFENGVINGIIIKNEENKAITKDSIFVGNKIWKRNNQFVKAQAQIPYAWNPFGGNCKEFSLDAELPEFSIEDEEPSYCLRNYAFRSLDPDDFFDMKGYGVVYKEATIISYINRYGIKILNKNRVFAYEDWRSYIESLRDGQKFDDIREDESPYSWLSSGKKENIIKIYKTPEIQEQVALIKPSVNGDWYNSLQYKQIMVGLARKEFFKKHQKQFLYCKYIGENEELDNCSCINVGEWLESEIVKDDQLTVKMIEKVEAIRKSREEYKRKAEEERIAKERKAEEERIAKIDSRVQRIIDRTIEIKGTEFVKKNPHEKYVLLQFKMISKPKQKVFYGYATKEIYKPITSEENKSNFWIFHDKETGGNYFVPLLSKNLLHNISLLGTSYIIKSERGVLISD